MQKWKEKNILVSVAVPQQIQSTTTENKKLKIYLLSASLSASFYENADIVVNAVAKDSLSVILFYLNTIE